MLPLPLREGQRSKTRVHHDRITIAGAVDLVVMPRTGKLGRLIDKRHVPLSPHQQNIPLTTIHCSLGGRAFGPPLYGGTPPATPPSKNTPPERYAVFAACRLSSKAAANQIRIEIA